jgi:VanW like protein/glycosyl transferase family 1
VLVGYWTDMHLRRPARAAGEGSEPTVLANLIFQAKVAGLRVQRRLRDRLHPMRRHAPGFELREAPIVAESITPLWTESGPAERYLTAGKVENLRQAVRRIHGVEIRSGHVFSFWAQVGRATRRRGFRLGRELREGCLVPSVGGGLCQLSNALYDAALQAGVEIVERHAHTRVIPGSLAEDGRDATVFWNYVDLRFRSDAPLRIEARLGPADLVVRLRRADGSGTRNDGSNRSAAALSGPSGSCETCDNTQCFRKREVRFDQVEPPARVYLLDERWPEFDALLAARATGHDLVLAAQPPRQPLAPQAGWRGAAAARVRRYRVEPLRRALALRRLAEQGQARQRALLRHAERLARTYTPDVPWDAEHLVVSQSLVPFLWRDGVLGGRTFDVWMTRLPMHVLHATLDEAATAHPESPTLADFRAEEALVEDEREALEAAARLITPHAGIAALFAEHAELLPWHLPTASGTWRRGRAVVFPASTLGRKGAYVLRSALRAFDPTIEVRVLGRELEGPGFWDGFALSRGTAGAAALDGAAVVVLPAYVEHQPRALLAAVAAGVPVIASAACGLHGIPGVITVPTGDVEALVAAMEHALDRSRAGRDEDHVGTHYSGVRP